MQFGAWQGNNLHNRITPCLDITILSTYEYKISGGKAIGKRQRDNFYDAIDEVFHQMREERSQELFEACSLKTV